MSKEFIDVGTETECLTPARSLSRDRDIRSNDARGEHQRDDHPSLRIKLTGYRLLNVTIILASVTLKASSYYHGHSISTALELVVGTFLAVILYYVGLLKDKRPGICPPFFQVDWAPPILEFVCRSEVYFFLLSLLPLWPAIELLQYALDVRRAAKCGQEVCASGPSAATVRNALLVAIVEISFCMLATLRQFTKVLGLRALHRFLAQKFFLTSLLVVWAVINCYISFHFSTIINGPSAQDIATTKYLTEHCLDGTPLLLMPGMRDSLAFGFPSVMVAGNLLIMWVYFENSRNPHYVLFEVSHVNYSMERLAAPGGLFYTFYVLGLMSWLIVVLYVYMWC